MRAPIDLRLQECAVALADTLNFSKAADYVHMAQPAFSRTIRQLEDLMGGPLFLRTSRKVELTDAGERFVQAARQALHYSFLAAQAMKPPETLVIGYPAHFDVGFVIDLGKLSVPGVRVTQFNFRSGSTAEIVSGLREQTMDCGILVMPYDYPEVSAFKLVPLFHHWLGILVSRNHPLARKRNLQLADLKNEPLILVAKDQNPVLYAWLESRCRESGFSPHVVQEVRHPYEYAAMVVKGVGIGLGGFSTVRAAIEMPEDLMVRSFTYPKCAIPSVIAFGDRFNYRPLQAYVPAVEKLRHRYNHSDQKPSLVA